jgi:hypothetical protein
MGVQHIGTREMPHSIMRFTRRSLLGLLAALATAAAAAASPPQGTAPAAEDDYRVGTAAGVVRIPRAEWKALPGSYRSGESFEQRKVELRQRFPRFLTVFTIHMTEDDRVGQQISPTEYLEMWVEQWGTLTVQVRVDKGRYWVMSRETILAPEGPLLDTSVAKALSDDEFSAARAMFEAEIERTRFLLTSQF